MNSRLKPAGWRELLLLALHWRQRYRIEGNSMLPLLHSDEQVLIRRSSDRLRVGDVVLARHPRKPELVLAKRIESITPEGEFVLRGDNVSASTDSREFGSVGRDSILGVVTSRL